MSHEIFDMFSVRELPWHGLGRVIDEAPTSEKALELAGLNWDVISTPVFVNGEMIEGYRANVRSTDNKVLGIVTDKYKIIQNREAFSFTDQLIGDQVRYETAGSLKGGKRIWLLARLPKTEIIGDEVCPYLVFTNSHDGTSSVQVCITPVRVVCMNTLNLALQGAPRSWAAKHTGDIQSKLEEAQRTLQLAEKYIIKLADEADNLAAKKITDKVLEEIIEELLPMPEESTDRQKQNIIDLRQELKYRYNHAPDLKRFRKTGWGVINSVADFIAHREPKRMTSTYKENLFGKIIDGHPLLDKAYELINKAA